MMFSAVLWSEVGWFEKITVQIPCQCA
ncbi:unnamed protein product [Victoria cruziana]